MNQIKSKARPWGIGAVILVLIGLVAYQVTRGESVVTFYTPEEVYNNPAQFLNKTFRVSGLVLSGTRNWDPNQRLLTFRMTDLKGHEFQVTHKGTPPDLFKEGQGVIAQGEILSADLKTDNRFQAQMLLVKHSEDYNTEQDHSKLRETKVLDSILKPQGGGIYAAAP